MKEIGQKTNSPEEKGLKDNDTVFKKSTLSGNTYIIIQNRQLRLSKCMTCNLPYNEILEKIRGILK